VRFVIRRLLILNLILLALAVAASVRFYNDWVMFEATHQTAAIQPQPEALPKIASTLAPNTAAPADWTEIPSRNPFSFDRTDISILQPAAPPKPPGPKPILFGTFFLGGDRLAMVAQGQPTGNRNSRSMKVGEVIDGWTISEIQDKSIVIKANSIEDTVIMNDPSAQVPRDNTRTLATSAAPVAVPVMPATQTGPFSQPPVSPPAAASTAGAAPQRRRVIQMTPFGPREIEEPIQ